jgi:polyphosphate glucokinase
MPVRVPSSAPSDASAPRTLVIDIGGTGLKATVLDVTGHPEHDRVRVATTYPCPPDKMVADLVELVKRLPPYQRVSAGFPGVVRAGHVLTAPHFVTKHGPGSGVDDALTKKWAGFDLAAALGTALGAPARVANDADVQGAGVVSGNGVELVITLGTGLGSAVFRDGRLALHLELAHHPAPTGATYNDYVGDGARKKLGTKRWNRRVRKAVVALDALIYPDSILIGGGNAANIDTDKLHRDQPAVGAKVRLVGNEGGLLGGIRLWEGAGLE